MYFITQIIISAEGRSSGSPYFVFQQPAYPRDCKEVSNACSSTNNTSGVYLIKPDGHPEPFEAYCDNDVDTGGWTVLQRRRSDSVNFGRSWKDFRNGFGFLGSEFWIGNEKIAVLTNQKRYQLRMDFENVAGETYYITYDEFRISDEWGDYYISSLGTFERSDETIPEWCPANEIFSNETCERTCDDPDTCISATSRTETEQCVCVGEYLRHQEQCIPLNQCNCFVAEKGSVLGEGHFYINSRCTQKSTCRNNRLEDESYQCSDHATCDERNGVRKCYCNPNYEGDGVTCTREVVPKDCHELYVSGTLSDGVYTIYPDGWPSGIQVYCEMESNGGGWTVIQRRSSASADFYRGWSDYKDGFGHKNQDHWLGNKYIHSMTNQKTYQLRIDLRDSASSSFHAVYSTFSINNEADKYRLSVGSYSGNAGNQLSGSNNKQFSTKDQDNDGWSTFNCAERHRGAWWFYEYYHCTYSYCRSYCPYYCYYFPDGSDRCAYCAYSHLNGDYDGSTRGTHMFWYSSSLNSYGCNLQYTDMKIRPV
ncbi:Ficolin-2 [Apostichopus japonicus]|uniref:Ficolin-2 n=1 Tax=Stichopus japonicus TaxID=307972 RepID=A0A2G8LIA5_STIJA|nr:Ficolin-2 [Apostichopus japonicus]